MSTTGISELDKVLGALGKKFGEDMFSHNYGNPEFFPTGSVSLDAWLRTGGWPIGRISEIIGPPGSFKTTLGLSLLAAHQRYRKSKGIDKRDLLIDLEHTITEKQLQGAGIDLDLIIWKRFYTMEPAFQLVLDASKTGAIGTMLFDSIDAAQNQRQVDKAVGEADMGIAKEMNRIIREYSKIVSEQNMNAIFINQIKTGPTSFGDPRTTTGGSALPFYASLRISMLMRKEHKDVPEVGIARGQCWKTKFSGPIDSEFEIPMDYGKGFNAVLDVEALAKTLEILRHSAGQTKVQWTSDSEMVALFPAVEKGKAAAFEALQTHPILVERLRATCFRALGIEAEPDSTFKDNELFQETSESKKAK